MARHTAPHTGPRGGGRHRAARRARLHGRPHWVALAATLLVAVVTLGPALPIRSLRGAVAALEVVVA